MTLSFLQNGFTPLYMASQEGHVEVVRLLVANRADPNLATDVSDLPTQLFIHPPIHRF